MSDDDFFNIFGYDFEDYSECDVVVELYYDDDDVDDEIVKYFFH